MAEPSTQAHRSARLPSAWCRDRERGFVSLWKLSCVNR